MIDDLADNELSRIFSNIYDTRKATFCLLCDYDSLVYINQDA